MSQPKTSSSSDPDQQPSQTTAPEVLKPVKRIKKRESSKRHFDAMMSGRRGYDKPFMCLPRATFHRLVTEIMADFKSDLRIQSDAVHTLQEDSELLLVERFKRCARLAEFCKRETVKKGDWVFMGEDEDSLALPYSGRS
jgi:histone H3/H4